MAEEIIETKATPIEDATGIRLLTGADEWLAEASGKARDIAVRYAPAPIADDKGRAKAVSDRAAARKAIKAIDDERKEKVGYIKRVLADFDARTREAISPLRSIDDEYKKYIDAYDEQRVEAKLADARATYEADHPVAAAAVPFDTLDAHFGKRDKWHTVTITPKKLIASIDEHAMQVEADLASIAAETAGRNDLYGSAVGEYARTLSLNDTLASVRQAKAVSEAREAEEATAAPEAADATAQPVAQPQVQAPVQPQPVAQPQAVQEPAPTPAPVPAYQPPMTEVPGMSGMAMPNYAEQLETHRYMFVTDPITEEQAYRIGATLCSMGIAVELNQLED